MHSQQAPKLLLIEPSGARREVVIQKTPFTIGRDFANDLLLRDNRISRRHATIRAENGHFLIEDCGSKHGTYVNGVRVEQSELHNNDRIEFGLANSYALIFASDELTIGELLRRVELPLAEATSRELRCLNLLLEVGRAMQGGLSLAEILTVVVDAAVEVTHAERGFLLLRDAQGQMEFAVARDNTKRTLEPSRLQLSRSSIDQAVRTRREVIVTDSAADEQLRAQQSIVGLELRTILCIPLEKVAALTSTETTTVGPAAEVLGVLYMDSRITIHDFTDIDREILRSLAGEATTVIENARLFQAAREKEKLDHELAIAREIQQALLPKEFRKRACCSVAGTNVPCQTVGGDYFDVVSLEGNRTGFVIADVSGKGISAALLTSMLQGAFAAFTAVDEPLDVVTNRVNEYLCERSTSDKFATLFYGVLEPEGEFRYVNAGHLPPLVRRASDEVERLTSDNIPLGLFHDAKCQLNSIRLKRGDAVVLYTDGFTEAENALGEMFGEERLLQAVLEAPRDDLEVMKEAICEQVRQFTAGAPQADDMTLLVVRYEGSANA